MDLFYSLPLEIFYLVVCLSSGVYFLIFSIDSDDGIELDIHGFNETFETVNYHLGGSLGLGSELNGKIRTPYKHWNAEKTKIRIEGKLSQTGSISKILSKPSVEITLDKTSIIKPEGFELYLVNSEGKPVYNTLKTKVGKQKFEFFVECKQTFESEELFIPKLIGFTVNITSKFGINKKKRRSLSYKFHIGPDLGESWVGFDPGTTASCITAATTANMNHENEIVIQKGEKGKEKITPSKIVFNKFEHPEKEIDPENIPQNLYDTGENTKAFYGTENGVSFHSIKKLLGFEDEQIIEFGNGKKLTLHGKQLASLLVKSIYDEFKSYVEDPSNKLKSLLTDNKFQPQRAVVAIPNNFTAKKIEDMLESVAAAGPFSEIRYVHEAEAVLLYCIRNRKFKQPWDKINVLVFDMGGATINATLVKVEYDQKKGYDIEILGKIGYGVGGDSIDYCMAKFLFTFKKDYPELDKINPFRNTSKMESIQERKEQMDLRISLQENVLVEWKKILADNYKNPEAAKNLLAGPYRSIRKIATALVEQILGYEQFENIENVGKFLNGFYEAFSEQTKFAAFEDELFKKYIYQSVADATKEILSYFDGAKGEKIDHIVFSGRSVFFPGIKSTVLQTVKDSDIEFSSGDEITLDMNEAKTAVAKGACVYGLLNNKIHIHSNKTFSSYGFIRSEDGERNSTTYTELIEMGTRFESDEKGRFPYCQGGITDLNMDFDYDGSRVNFLQIMGHNPEEILKAGLKHRFSKVASLKVYNTVDVAAVRVQENDLIVCGVTLKNEDQITSEKALPEQKIAAENEDHYTWLVQ